MKVIARRGARLVVYAAALVLALLALIVLAFASLARARLADLRPWHRLELTEEFRADRAGAPETFEQYLALEDRLFAELRRELLDDPERADTWVLGRFNPRSVPGRLALDTNRSFELVPEQPRGAVLLVHGLTDSPYSMRAIAEVLHEQGFYVLVLRLPGHGTVPAGLLDVRWQDWEAAVVLAARHAAARAGPGQPFYAGGFSTGAALTTLYSARALQDETLPRPRRLVLVSAAIGIPGAARVTRILAKLSFLEYFEKSKWLDVLPEYDPHKYNSFPVNAAHQIYRLTLELQATLDAVGEQGLLERMPDVLAFQSLIDSTVTSREVVAGLMGRLTPGDHELVVFDVNRRGALLDMVSPQLVAGLENLKATPVLPFRLTVVSNRSADSDEVALSMREAGESGVRTVDLELAWPKGVLSLGHVALPMRPDDPVYGLWPAAQGELDFPLGALSVRGESGTLVVPLGNLARLRSNPFFDVIRTRLVETLRADAQR